MNKHFLILLATAVVTTYSQYQPMVCRDDIDDLCYRGSWLDAPNSKYASFQEIRYALAPTGDLRFKSPKKYMPSGTYDVGDESTVVCPQINGFTLVGVEDCLFLNVYVPKKAIDDKDIKLPVMVFIHGGSLITGSGNFRDYGPLHFMDKDVILVTINYRLGPFGFFFMGDDMVSGNAGLKDQVMALQWVQDNIQSFGGDPNSVTIFGESAGSFSVSVHILSPLSVDLFHRAVMQSRSAIGPGWHTITPEHGIHCAKSMSGLLDCGQDALKCLQDKPMNDILIHTNDLGIGNCWMAVQDTEYTSEPFLVGDPEELLMTGEFNQDIDVMIGTNADEGIFSFFGELANPNLWEDIRNDADTIMPLMLFGLEPSEVTDLDRQRANQLIEFYIGSSENINEEHKQGMIDMMTDSIFLYGTHRTIKHMVNYGKQIFQYVLTYQGRFSFSNIFGVPTMGVCHADDLLYLFEPLGASIGWEIQPLNEEEIALRTTMVSAWTNFAKYGDPTPPDSGLRPWEPIFAGKEPLYWNITGPEPIMDMSPILLERMEKWEEVLGVSNALKISKFNQEGNANKQNKDCLEDLESCHDNEECCSQNCLSLEGYSFCYSGDKLRNNHAKSASIMSKFIKENEDNRQNKDCIANLEPCHNNEECCSQHCELKWEYPAKLCYPYA